MAAAWSAQWPIGGHGLAEDRESIVWQGGNILTFQVKPTPRAGLFGAVAATLGVKGLSAPVDLGALCAALPSLNPLPGNTSLLALPVWPDLYVQQSRLTLLLSSEHRGYVWLREQAPPEAAAIVDLLTHYPAAEGSHLEIAQTIIQMHPTPWGDGVPVRWPAPQVEHPAEGPPAAEYIESFVQNRIPAYVYQREHWLVPRVGEGRDELPPFLLWWVLIFGLSLLARYEPEAWRAALDPDTSELAVPLEELLDDALSVTPALLSQAVTHEAALRPGRI